jgi:hypothetical protein
MDSSKEQHPMSETQETMAKWITGTAAFLYGFGFLITNDYLTSIGISDFSSLKPKFIITGSWATAILFLVISPGFGPGIVVYSEKNRKKLSEWKRALGWSALFLSVSIAARTVALFWLWPDISSGELLIRLSCWLAILVGACLFTMFVAYLIEQSEALETADRRGAAWLMRLNIGILMVGALCVATVAIARRSYVYVPDALGGGRPTNARLLLSERGASVWKQTGVSVSAERDSLVSVPIRILYQSGNDLVVEAPYMNGLRTDVKVVILKKDLVNAILPQLR